MNALITDGAIAQSGRTPGIQEWKAKLASDYHAQNYRAAIVDSAALQKLHALDAETAMVTAQAYYLAGDRVGCMKYLQDNFSLSKGATSEKLFKRCQQL